MALKQVLIVNPSNLLSSQPIQIIHKHPDFSHKIRSDLDPHEVIAFSYPIILANKIVPFLEVPTSSTAATARTRSPKRQKTASPTRRTRRKINADAGSEVQFKTKSRSPRRSSPSKSSTDEDTTIIVTTTKNLNTLPTPLLTPHRQLTPPPSSKFTPATVNTAYTSRTISPGGTVLSQLKPLPLLWSSVHSTSQLLTQNPSNIPPSALFTPAKPPASTVIKVPITKPTVTAITTTQKSNRSRNPPRLIHFDDTPISLDHRTPRPTLCLRHDLPTQGLRDVFEWCLISVEAGAIVDLIGWMVKFRDTARVRGIVEVCQILGLVRMGSVAENLLKRMEEEFGFGDGVV